MSDLELRSLAELKTMPKTDIRAVQARREFRLFQRLVRQGLYGKIWDSVFSKDYQDASFQSLDTFEKAMTGDIPISTYHWERDTLLRMRPASVGSSGDLIALSVKWQGDLANQLRILRERLAHRRDERPHAGDSSTRRYR